MGEPTQLEAYKRAWNQDERDRLSSGDIRGAFAGPDQSYPIAGPGDVRDAWGLAGKADNPDKIRRRIISIAKKFGWLSGLPATAKQWAADHNISLGKTLGDAVKAVGYKGTDDRWLVVQNHIVLFGDEAKKDLTGEWFDGDTDLESDYTQAIGRLPVDFEHGEQVDGKAAPGRDDILGYTDWETAEKTDNGWLVKSMLDRRNRYVQMFEPLIQERLIGTSSEAVLEDIQVEDSGHIRRWPLKRNSLTVTPAEPGMLSDNALSAYKNLQDVMRLPELPEQEPEEDTGAEGQGEPMKSTPISITEGEPKMTEEVVTLEQFNELQDNTKALGDRIDQLLEQLANSPAAKGEVIAPDSEEDHPETKSFADFLYAVMVGNQKRLAKVYQAQYDRKAFANMKDLSGDVGAQGGVLVPEEYTQQLLQVAAVQSRIMGMVNTMPTSRGSGKIPALDQYISITAGSGQVAEAAGAVLATVEAGGTFSEANINLTQIQYRLSKVGAFVDVEQELMDDSPFAIEALLRSLFALALANKNERNVLRGSGAGEPLGILNWQGAIGVTPGTNNVFGHGDAKSMISQFKQITNNVAWLVHPGVLPDIYGMESSSGGPAYLANFNESPDGMLFGYPIIRSGHLPQDDNSGCAILADLGVYMFWQKQSGLAVAYSEHVNFKQEMGCWRFSHRNDGKPWLINKIELPDPQGSYYQSPFVYLND